MQEIQIKTGGKCYLLFYKNNNSLLENMSPQVGRFVINGDFFRIFTVLSSYDNNFIWIIIYYVACRNLYTLYLLAQVNNCTASVAY